MYACAHVCVYCKTFRQRVVLVKFFKASVNELPFSLLTSDHFLLLEILEGYLPQVTSVVTSRPWAVQQLLENFGNQHL